MVRLLIAILYMSAQAAMATEPPPDTTCEDQAAWGYIDQTGKFVIQPSFLKARSFSEGLAAVKTKNYRFGFIDKKGRLIIPAKWYEATSFVEGHACVTNEKRENFLINRKGVPILSGLTHCVLPSEGLVLTTINKKYGFYSLNGKRVIPFKVNSNAIYGNFKEGLASYLNESKRKCGFINKKGQLTLVKHKGRFCGVREFSEGMAPVYVGKKGGKYSFGFVNRSGKIVIPPRYENVGPFRQGLAAVSKNDLWGFINRTGKLVIPMQYDFEGYDPFHYVRDGQPRFADNGWALVKESNVGKKEWQRSASLNWVFIDKTGKQVLKFSSTLAVAYREGLALRLGQSNSGFYDRKGKRVVSIPYYESAHFFSEGMLRVCTAKPPPRPPYYPPPTPPGPAPHYSPPPDSNSAP